MSAEAATERPDDVRCVRTGRCDRPYGHTKGVHAETRLWCGRESDPSGWYFVDASHAALAAPTGRLVPCPECVAAIKRSLDGEAVLPPLR